MYLVVKHLCNSTLDTGVRRYDKMLDFCFPAQGGQAAEMTRYWIPASSSWRTGLGRNDSVDKPRNTHFIKNTLFCKGKWGCFCL